MLEPKNNCDAFSSLYKSFQYCNGQVSLPGCRARVYFIPKRDIVKWPKLKMTDATDMKSVAQYDGNFVLAADKNFKYIDLVDGENEPKSEQVGAFGSFHFNNTATLVIPGTEEEQTGLITLLNNENTVFIVQQRNGKARIFGSEAFNAQIKPSQNWGKGTSDSNNSTLEITAEDMAPAPFYPGDIVCEGGVTYSGADGSLKETTSEDDNA